MAMGRSRITGTKTRLELAWQKEREEQQRLIQESSTLARDLRQTLLEVRINNLNILLLLFIVMNWYLARSRKSAIANDSSPGEGSSSKRGQMKKSM